MNLAHLPLRVATGAYILNSGLSKQGLEGQAAEGMHGMAADAIHSSRRFLRSSSPASCRGAKLPSVRRCCSRLCHRHSPELRWPDSPRA